MDNLDFEAATEEIKQAVSHVKENGADKVRSKCSNSAGS